MPSYEQVVLIGLFSCENYLDIPSFLASVVNPYMQKVFMFFFRQKYVNLQDRQLLSFIIWRRPYPTLNLQVNGMPITVGVGNVISEEGFSLLMSPAAAGAVWNTILSQGAIPMGSNAWEKLRVLQGGEFSTGLFAYLFLFIEQLVCEI